MKVSKKKSMIFEDRVDWLLENGFYLHRACTYSGAKNFRVIIGKGDRLYLGEENTLSDAFTESMNNYEKGETWPSARPRKASSSVSYEELDGELKNLGIDLN